MMFDPDVARELQKSIGLQQEREREQIPHERTQQALAKLPGLVQDAARQGSTRIVVLSTHGSSGSIPALSQMESWFKLTYDALVQSGFDPFITVTSKSWNSPEWDGFSERNVTKTSYAHHLVIELDPVESNRAVYTWNCLKADANPEDAARFADERQRERIASIIQATDGSIQAAEDNGKYEYPILQTIPAHGFRQSAIEQYTIEQLVSCFELDPVATAVCTHYKQKPGIRLDARYSYDDDKVSIIARWDKEQPRPKGWLDRLMGL